MRHFSCILRSGPPDSRQLGTPLFRGRRGRRQGIASCSLPCMIHAGGVLGGAALQRCGEGPLARPASAAEVWRGHSCPRVHPTRTLKVRKIPRATGTWNPTVRKARKVGPGARPLLEKSEKWRTPACSGRWFNGKPTLYSQINVAHPPSMLLQVQFLQ